MLTRQAYFPIVALYVILGAAWAAFAHWIAPHIIDAAYVDWWNQVAGAVEIALVLHFVIVLFVGSIDYRHKLRYREAAKTNATANLVLIAFSAVFLTTTAITGPKNDYNDYVIQWTSVLNGEDPWAWHIDTRNAYGPLFNILAPMIWLNPLFNKLLCAFSYLVYVIWLVKEYGPRRNSNTPSWFCYGLLLFNLFPWLQLAYFGYFDVLVGLACVAAIHSLVHKKDSLSGIYLASGILLKFLPIVVLPFLASDGRRFHSRLVGWCVAFVAVGFLASVLVWGTSTFAPLAFAATRRPVWSIYYVMDSQHSPLRFIWDTPHAEWLEKPLLLMAGLSLFAWSTFRQIEPSLSATLAILVTLLLYRVGYPNYHLVFLCMVSYWAVSEWCRFKTILAVLLIGYFNFLAVTYFSYWMVMSEYFFHSNTVIALLQFLLGCTVLIGLIWFSTLSSEPRLKRERTVSKNRPVAHGS